MSIQQIVILIATFAIVFGATLGVLLMSRSTGFTRRIAELERQAPGGIDDMLEQRSAWVGRLERLSRPLARLAAPATDAADTRLRRRLFNAGWRNASAVPIYYGAKTLLALLLPSIAFPLLAGHVDPDNGTMLPALLLGAALVGFYLPTIVLDDRIRRRQQEIFESFPDGLDLITVCVEAGLSMDAALVRLVDEMQVSRAVLAEEFHLMLLELRAGLARDKALRNLAMRTGVEDIDMLVSMLIQADRFGTSIADSLRVHSEMLRAKRRVRAEERGAKVAVKLLFPLIFFIFPALLVVLMGSPAIQIYRSLLPTMSGG